MRKLYLSVTTLVDWLYAAAYQPIWKEQWQKGEGAL